MKNVCVRCEHGKGYFSGGKIMYVGKDGSVSVDTRDGPIIDLPVGTIKYCPWCGKKLHPTEKGGAE